MKTSNYVSNIIPRGVRVALIIFIVIQAFYIWAELAMGIIYLPAKTHGLLLSGFPVIMIACSSLSLCLAALATIIDHYDKRPNERAYRNFTKYCIMLAAALFLFAPILQGIASLCLIFGIKLLPEVHGFAEHYTFYRPELKKYLYLLNPVLGNISAILWFAIPSCLLGAVLFTFKSYKRLSLILIFSGGAGVSLLFLFSVILSFLEGRVGGYKSVVYYAEVAPAQFNAVLLTQFSFAILLFLSCMAVVVIAALNHPNLKKI